MNYIPIATIQFNSETSPYGVLSTFFNMSAILPLMSSYHSFDMEIGKFYILYNH